MRDLIRSSVRSVRRALRALLPGQVRSPDVALALTRGQVTRDVAKPEVLDGVVDDFACLVRPYVAASWFRNLSHVAPACGVHGEVHAVAPDPGDEGE